MESDGAFDYPDGDVVLRATHGTDSRDFRIHKLLLSLASPVFKDMFQLAQPSPSTLTVDTIDIADPPRAVEVILRLIYPSSDPPAISDLTLLSEVLGVAEKYNVAVARSRVRRLLVEFAKTEPLRVYGIAYRLGYEEEMKIASSHSISIHLPGLTELPEELKFIPAMEFHRLIVLHARYRKEVAAIADRVEYLGTPIVLKCVYPKMDLGWREKVLDPIRGGTPLNYESLARAVGKGDNNLNGFIRLVLDEANALNLTV